MKYYLATFLRNADKARVMNRRLGIHGHTNTGDWTGYPDLRKTPLIHPEPQRQVRAEQHIDSITAADFVVVLYPGGRGTHCEMGIALGLGKPIFLVVDHPLDIFIADPYPCVFIDHALVHLVESAVMKTAADRIHAIVERTL